MTGFVLTLSRFDGVPDGALKYIINLNLTTIKHLITLAHMIKYGIAQTKNKPYQKKK